RIAFLSYTAGTERTRAAAGTTIRFLRICLAAALYSRTIGVDEVVMVSKPIASRERLLREGLAIARRSGLRAITVRGVATRARVNLGSFVYHFGSRDAFVGELLERWYAPLMAELQIAVDAEGPPLERLRGLILQFVDWVRANSGFIAHV